MLLGLKTFASINLCACPLKQLENERFLLAKGVLELGGKREELGEANVEEDAEEGLGHLERLGLVGEHRDQLRV